jgi:hypothetical protein
MEMAEAGRLVAMQRLAHAIGVAHLHPGSQLCIHPTYGPWIALRAVVVFRIDAAAAGLQDMCVVWEGRGREIEQRSPACV